MTLILVWVTLTVLETLIVLWGESGTGSAEQIASRKRLHAWGWDCPEGGVSLDTSQDCSSVERGNADTSRH